MKSGSSASGIAARRRFRSADFAKWQQSRVYDLVMRLPLLAWSVICTMAWMAGLARYMREADPALPHAVFMINIAMRLSAIAFLVLLAASVVLRARPSGRARGSSRGFPPSPVP
jgi:hypothetical protein